MAPLVGNRETLERIVNHIFLPPQLPQQADESDLDAHLLNITHKALSAFKTIQPAQRPLAIDSAAALLTNATICHSSIDGTISEADLFRVLGGLGVNHSVALQVRAQNAGLLLTRKRDHVCFEIFELSPQNADVLAARGRLVRNFPGFAVSLPSVIFETPGFQATIAQALAQMSVQAAPGMQPKIEKKGSLHDEERDTAHPWLVSGLFGAGFLKSLGNEVQVETILKNTRDEVLWDDAEVPWRRSPTWILIRVTLNIVFSRAASGSSTLYKSFMAFLMAELLDAAQQLSVSTDMQYVMYCKLSRRLQKLERFAGTPGSVRTHVQRALTVNNAAFRRCWDVVKKTQPHLVLDLLPLKLLSLASDSVTPIAKLDQYIRARKSRQSKSGVADFVPRSGLVNFSSRGFPILPVHDSDLYRIANLQGFENWVVSELRSTVAASCVEDTCERIVSLIKSYHGLTSAHYEAKKGEHDRIVKRGNPEGVSIAILVLLELWVAMDRRAVEDCDLLGQYDPEIPVRLFQSLLLPSKEQMRRLHEVETYLTGRKNRAHGWMSSAGLFGPPRNAHCFAARYFDSYQEHAELLEEIETQGQEGKRQKEQELEDLRAEHTRLKQQALQMEHTFIAVPQAAGTVFAQTPSLKHDESNCRKCRTNKDADELSIRVHEWPLPANESEAKAVVFELQVPSWYAHWRDGTVYLLQKVLKATLPASKPVKDKDFELSKDPHLGNYYQARETQSVILWTSKKPHATTHRRKKCVVKATPDVVCVANATHYQYLQVHSGEQDESDAGVYINKFSESLTVVHDCTYALPVQSEKLQAFLFRPHTAPDGLPPNVAIAGQSASPSHMTTDEYKELCTLPFGHQIQWYNILLQIAAPTVDFKKEETVIAFLQCIYQAGPPCRGDDIFQEDVLRTSHNLLKHSAYVRCMLSNLHAALQKVKENWESVNALVIFAAIASRLLSVNRDEKVQEGCLSFLAKVRKIAFTWLVAVRARAHSAIDQVEHSHYLVKCVEVALVCCVAFDVEQQHLSQILLFEEDASILLQCSLILAERRRTDEGLIPILDRRLKRILHSALPMISKSLVGVDVAVKQVWSGYHPSPSGWHQDDDDPWLQTELDEAMVHFNLLTGELLVDALRLSKPPKAYERHPIYKSLFGNSDVEVMPSRRPGMSFSTTLAYHGYSVHLGMRTTGPDDILIQASDRTQTYEIVPSRLFTNVFPEQFVDNYVHWLDVDNDIVQFRPVSDPWNSTSGSIWILSEADDSCGWHLRNDGLCLHGLASPTARIISDILSPLADSSRVHVTLQPSQMSVAVDIPTLRLAFTLDLGDSLLRSKEYRGMIVDSSQSICTLTGLSNYIVLKPIQKGSRKLLLPEGPVSYRRQGDHIIVIVDRSEIVTVHPFDLDERIGRLVGNGNLQGKLFLAYLHSLTASRLPDPFTRTTGTEQALSILRSAATRSFQQLSQENVKLLFKIARLTPERSFYPTSDKVMQRVTWDIELSFLSQPGDFCKAVQEIFNQAKRSKMFYPCSDLRLPALDHTHDELLERSLVFSSMYAVAGFGAEHHKSRKDVVYASRDRDEGSKRAKNAYILSGMVNLRSDALHWTPLAHGQLWNDFKDRDVVFGSSRPFDTSMLRYDAVFLQESEASVKTNLLPLHDVLSTRQGEGIERFALMMWLSTMAFSEHADLLILQTIAMLHTTARFRGLQPPETESFTPKLGLDLTKEALFDALMDARVGFQNSPDFISPVRPNETALNAHYRRPEDYERRSKGAVLKFCINLKIQWPCRVPVTPDAALWKDVIPYIDVTKAMGLADGIFKAFWDNHLLHRYLGNLEICLAGLSPKSVQVPTWFLSSPERPLAADGNTDDGCAFIEDVFKGYAPQIPEAPRLEVEKQAYQNGPHCNETSRLGDFLVTLQQSTGSSYDQDNIADLQRSATSLQARSDAHTTTVYVLPSQKQLTAHLTRCEAHLGYTYDSLLKATDERLRIVSGAIDSFQWPRVSPTMFLEQLGRCRWPHLGKQWKTAIIQYGLAMTSVQRAERLLMLFRRSAKEDLRRELQNTKYSNYDPMKYPESLLLEVEGAIMIRPVQEEIAALMRDPPGGRNSVMQLNMGEGKSSVIVPMVAAPLANDKQLVRVIVAKPQSKQMAQMLIAKIGGLMNRRVYYMPYSRALRLDKSSAEAVEDLCEECKCNGGVLLVHPEHLLSFNLTGLECYIAGNEAAGKVFLRIQDFFDKESRDIIDESDENFSVRFELIYTMGLRRPVEFSPSRWIVTQQILSLVQDIAHSLAKEYPNALEVHERASGGFPRLRILQSEVAQFLVKKLADHICEFGLRDFPLALQPKPIRDAVFAYITKVDINVKEANAVEQGPFWTEHTKSILLLLRGLLAQGILEFVFCTKRWRVNYGLTTREPATRLAVPFRAKDFPAQRSEYSQSEVVILLTSLSYYYGGLDDADLFVAFDHLMTSDQADEQYQSWTKCSDVPVAFRNLSGINLKDSAQCVSKLFPRLRHSKDAIDYFLSHIVFTKEMKEYPFKLSASGCDLGKAKTLPTTGFSGTNDTRNLLPLDVQQLDLPDQSHTNALVLNNILQPGNSVALLPKPHHTSRTDAQRLLDLVMQLKPLPEVILDVGAQILELDNLSVAQTWLQQTNNFIKEAAVFCDDNDDLRVVDRQGRVELLHTSSFFSRLDVCLVYLDEAHTRGIDLQLPAYYRAAVTLGPKLTKDRLVQACMRMRKLGNGQTVVFCVPDDINFQIQATSQKLETHLVDVEDVLRWVISETHSEIRQCIPLWTVQNYNFAMQLELWEKNLRVDGRSLSRTAAEEFLEPEARDIEFRYRPRLNARSPLRKLENATNPRLKAIEEKCRKYGDPNFNLRKLNAEQERELSPEIDVDAEREVQKPPLAEPVTHSLHNDLLTFVNTGMAVLTSKAYGPAFEVLRKTSAGEQFDVSQLRQPFLFATKDFERTVVDPGTGSLSDSYQRPVQWVLTGRMLGRNDVGYIIIVSPFEAQQLIKHVQRSPVAALHLYRPRYNLAFCPMDKLDFYTISQAQVSLDVPLELSVRLSIFAGQLYLSSYEEYRAVCKFLGLAAEPPKKNWVVAADGFILRDDEGHPGGAVSHIRKSPVNFLKILLSKIRRNGDDISKSHMGALLEGLLLSKEFFEAKEGM